MNIEMLVVAVLVLIGTGLLTRVAAQCLAQARLYAPSRYWRNRTREK